MHSRTPTPEVPVQTPTVEQEVSSTATETPAIIEDGTATPFPTDTLPPTQTLLPPTATPTAEPTVAPSPTARPALIVHNAAAGETLDSVAALYGADADRVADANGMLRGLPVRAGQTLYVPTIVGAMHAVAPGETLSAIAAHYGVEVTAIVEANGLADSGSIAAGQRLLVPGVSAPLPTPTGFGLLSATPAATSTPPPTAPPLTIPTARPPATPVGPPSRAVPAGGFSALPAPAPAASVLSGAGLGSSTGPLRWPTFGSISTAFGEQGHTGIDIMGNVGDPVLASAAGIVTVALENEAGYGWRVEIDHGNGLTTLYAHLSAFSVKAGQQVVRGQRLGAVGSTGVSTGPHLHFEVRVGSVPANPIPFLP
jgi:murein DD-endopeptidase MepM/ murein hydrolase activator NlpD